MKEKLIRVGIDSPQRLAELTGKKIDMAKKVWFGKIRMSLAMALNLKEKTGIPIDYWFN